MKTITYIVAAIALVAFIAGPALADDAKSVFKPDRVSRIIGANAIDHEGQSLGTISDLMIAKDNQISYVVVARSDESGFVALPFEAVAPQVNPDGDVVLSVAKADFDEAPRFASNSWPELSDNDSARAYRSTPDSMDTQIVNGITTVNPYSF
jgi:hypothetical protein